MMIFFYKKKDGKTRSKKQLHGRDEIQIQDVTKKCHGTVPKAPDTGFNPTIYNAQWVNGSKAGDLSICSCGQRHSTHLLRISERIKGKRFAYNW